MNSYLKNPNLKKDFFLFLGSEWGGARGSVFYFFTRDPKIQFVLGGG